MNMHRILVLDDDMGVCTVLSRILRDQQYDVYTSQSVISAAETVTERSFDAYLLDYRLPDGTGLQVAEKVRQQGSNAPIILISGYGATDIAAKAVSLDISEVLQKPFTRETISNALKRALSPALSPPITVPKPTVEDRAAEPRFSLRLHPPLIILISIALLLIAFWIFLSFR